TQAGYANSSGTNNAFFGYLTGSATTNGDKNSFFGNQSGLTNTTGNNNTLVGWDADVATGNLSFATAIGAGAVASLSNSLYLGRTDGWDAVRIPGPVVIDG